MKKTLSLLLVLVMVLSLCSVTAFAAENYTGKTVILYTANVRGDVDVYAKVAAAKTAYENAGADVILADAGNFLQGTAAANSDRGLGVYNLMDAAGYDVAAMGLRNLDTPTPRPATATTRTSRNTTHRPSCRMAQRL